MMKGWHKDNYRHSLAAKGYNVKISRRRSMAGVMAQPSYPVEPAPVPKRHVDNVAWDWLKDTGNYMFKENSGISNKNVLSESIEASWKEWLFNPKSKSQEKLVGGIADNVPDEKFVPEELVEGTVVEMEHTKDPEVAKEIAKDHIVENSKPLNEKYDSDYYKKLKQMETQL